MYVCINQTVCEQGNLWYLNEATKPNQIWDSLPQINDLGVASIPIFGQVSELAFVGL